ncbi:MAG: T9SS type A sorting domain-containing protein [Lewinella sp.]
MRHLLLTSLLFLFSLSLFAQERFDYQFFHLGVQYLFEDLTADSEFESPLLGMHLKTDDAHPDADGPLAAYMSLDEIVENSLNGFKLVPSFAGQEVQQVNGLTTMTMGEGQESIIIRNNATVGDSWMATSLVVARVDSVREEVFRTFTDSVKYVSFSLVADGSSVAATIRISKNHGLLTSVFFRELMEPQTAMLRWLVITPEEDQQLPVLDNVLDIPEGTVLDIERVQDAYNDQAGDYIYIAKQHKITIGDFQQDTTSGIWEQDFTYDEFRFTVKNDVREEAYDLSFTENLIGRYRLTEQRHNWLNAQPGAAVITDAPGSNGDTTRVLVYLKDFSCFGLGKRRSDYLFQDEQGVWNNNDLREDVRSGYYFQQLGGPYFTVGALSQNLNDLEATLGTDGAVCGEPFNFSFFDTQVLGMPFDWQLFRPGVQYLYEKPSFDQPEYLGMKLTGNGEEAAFESLRGEDINCRQLVPSFAGIRVRQEPELTTLLFYSDSLHLRPGAQIGEGWIANDTTLATVDSIVWETFLGLNDSVKYISFEQRITGEPIGTPIRISKLYGLLTATYFYDLDSEEALPLAGMSKPEVGLQAPSFQSLTDFSAGDEYHTRIINTVEDMSRVYYETVETQATVLNTVRIGDSLVHIFIKKNELTYRSTFPGTNETDSIYRSNRLETIVYDLREQPWLGGQAGQHFTGLDGDQNLIQVIPGDCLGTYLLLDLHSGPNEEACYSWMSGLIGHNGTYLNQVAGPFDQSVEGSHTINELLYFNNTTCSEGTPLNFNGLIDGVNDFRPDERIRLYPNPSDGQVNLEVPVDLGPVALSVFSITGQQLLTFEAATGNRAVSLGPLPHGTYTLVFYNATGPVGRRRVVLSR